MPTLWPSPALSDWDFALARYDATIARQGVTRLPDLDRWYQHELPPAIASRALPHITHDELVRLTEWKMARGVWRAPNLVLVRGNATAKVVEVSASAFALTVRPVRPTGTARWPSPATGRSLPPM